MITERYIKMCEKAEEIQREWKPELGDRYWNTFWKLCEYNYSEVICSSSFEKGDIDEKVKNIWLPTQEQLQEMLDGDYFYHAFNLDVVNETMKRLYSEDGLYSPFETGNEFWLAFVMWKRYGKVWDDEKEEWVKGDSYDQKI